MNNNPTPYPLAWPTGWPRTRAGDRERSRFRNARAVDDQLSMTDATSRLIRECRLLGAANVIVSTNVAVRRDGLPYARQRTPEDPGAAVYFKLDSVPEGLVLACDRWLRVEDNIAAIAAHIGALRGIDRWGVGSVRQAFAGYKRLSAGDAPTPWWEVLGIDRQAPAVAVKKAYEELAKLHHPDRETGNLETIPGHQQCVEGVPENAGVVNGSSARPGEPTTPPGAPTSPGAWAPNYEHRHENSRRPTRIRHYRLSRLEYDRAVGAVHELPRGPPDDRGSRRRGLERDAAPRPDGQATPVRAARDTVSCGCKSARSPPPSRPPGTNSARPSTRPTLDRAAVALERAEKVISDLDAEIRIARGPARVRDRGVDGVD